MYRPDFRIVLLVPILLVGLIACATKSTLTPTVPIVSLENVFPANNAIPGWTTVQPTETYNRDNLFSLVDGQAESFFAYAFEQVVVQRYQNTDGVRLSVEIWQLATPADAYGLFTAGRAGEPVAIGNGGDSDPGRRLAFWQNRYFVSLNASQNISDSILQSFAKAIAGVLPTGGGIPAIVKRLPQTGLVERSGIFFHEEMSIQTEVWLGGENLLGLDQETAGVVAHYDLDGTKARLMLIEYPTTEKATAGLKALRESTIKDLAASDTSGNILGAVFGKADSSKAQTLLKEALK